MRAFFMTMITMNIFITGASSGIGQALAIAYAKRYKQQVKLGLLGRNTDALEQLAAKLKATYATDSKIYMVDVRQPEAVQQAATSFISTYGATNIVIAAAGVSRGTLTENPEDTAAFQAVMDINVMGMLHTFSPFIESMQQSSEPCHLVGIASVAGIRGLPGAGAYSASKSAVISYLESLRVEMRPYNIHVTTIAPGYIKTPMTAINQYKMPFLMDVDIFAEKCIKAVETKTRFKIIPWQMGWVAKLMRLMPTWLYDKLASHAPHKKRTDWDWL